MKMRTGLAGIGAAVVFAFAAQAAQAQTCPTNGGGTDGGVEQVEVPGDESCSPTSYYTPITVVAENATGEEYTVTGEVEFGDDYLQIGEVVEVEINLDDIMAALKADEKNAVALAAAVGIHVPDKSGVMDAAVRVSDAKLTEAEYEALANYMHVSLQSSGRATGRSDPASNSFTRRVEAYAQAFGRMLSTITRNLPSISYSTRTREYNDQGVLVRERETDFHIGGGN